MCHQDFEDLLYLKDYAIVDRSLSAIFLPNPLWVRDLLLAVLLSKRIELEGCNCTKSQDNSIQIENLV